MQWIQVCFWRGDYKYIWEIHVRGHIQYSKMINEDVRPNLGEEVMIITNHYIDLHRAALSANCARCEKTSRLA